MILHFCLEKILDYGQSKWLVRGQTTSIQMSDWLNVNPPQKNDEKWGTGTTPPHPPRSNGLVAEGNHPNPLHPPITRDHFTEMVLHACNLCFAHSHTNMRDPLPCLCARYTGNNMLFSEKWILSLLIPINLMALLIVDKRNRLLLSFPEIFWK